jgi:Rha family phage regulatory protein
MELEVVQEKEGQATTTSLIVADRFGKRHGDVLRSIQHLDCSEEFTERNFAFCSYNDRGRPMPMYHMTRDGFMFLVMGFTGPKAAGIKEAFIDQFNKMEMWIRDRMAMGGFVVPRTLPEALQLAPDHRLNRSRCWSRRLRSMTGLLRVQLGSSCTHRYGCG